MEIQMDDKVNEGMVTFGLNANHPAGPKELLRIGGDGRFYVEGREVETDEEVRDILVRFARALFGGPTVGTAACRVVAASLDGNTSALLNSIEQMAIAIEAEV